MKTLPRVPLALALTGCLVALAGQGAALQSGNQASGTAAGAPQQMSRVDPSFLSALEWRFVGPPRGGRSVAVVGDPNDPLVFYFGATHGGVWKTTDAGASWQNLSDRYFKTSPVGAIDVSLSNPQIVYVGMGEAIPRQNISPGDGVYKSADGGKTWVNVGLEETRHISKIRIHPTDPDIVYVAAMGDLFGQNPERGVFRTKDGGKTWERVLYKSDRAAAFDLVMDPTNPKVLYASLDQFQRLPWDQMSGGPDSGLYTSTDGGDTWTNITHNPGLPKGDVGKIGLALSPARPSRVWAFVEAEDGALFRSDDSGKTWQRLNESRDMRRSAASYMHIIADTQDPDTVYIASYRFWKSTDGGKTFSALPTPHGDNHALWIDPKNSKRMIEGNDGGATVTLNGGATWSTLLNQPTAELFGLAIDDQVPYRLYAAQNDNTHLSIPSRTSGGAIAWTDNEAIPGGEGGQTAVRPDGMVVYGADRAGITRYDRRTGQGVDVSVWPDDEFTKLPKDVKYRFYYTFPLLLSPHDPNVLYTAGSRVFRTTDEGNSWEAISPDLSRNRQDKMQKMPGGPFESMWSSLYWVCLAQSLAESPLEKGELWVGLDDSTVQMTKDGGKTWQNVSPPDLGEWTTIATIDVSHHARGTVYLAAHRYRVSDRTPLFYRTTDYGRTWQKITSGIRANDFARAIREDPVRPGLLYAGTDTGVYVSFDAGGSWQSLQRNLPAVSAQYMQVKNDDLVVATHGRGFWIMDNVTPLRQITPEVTTALAHLFDIAPTRRYLPMRTPVRVPGRARRVPSDAGENPPQGVNIDYYLKTPSGEVTLTVLDGKGQTIKRFSSEAKGADHAPAEAGLNRFVWDLRYPGAREIPTPEGFVPAEYPRAQPPFAPPGRYSARLSAGGRQYEESFEIRKDPRVTATEADLQAQFEFSIQIRDRLSAVTDAVERLRKARQQLDTRPASDTGAAAAREKLATIEGTLTRLLPTVNRMKLPPMGLTNRLAALTRSVVQADARPTRQMYAVFQDLSAAVAEQERQLEAVIKAHVPTLTSQQE